MRDNKDLMYAVVPTPALFFPKLPIGATILLAIIVPVIFFTAVYIKDVKETLPPMKIIGMNQTITIEDNVELFDDEARSEIMSSFENFRDKTGITPRMVVTFNETWNGNYDTLKDYAVHLYNSTISDSKHWLLVYSVSYSDPEGDWCWQTVDGVDIYPLLTDYVTQRFSEVFEDGVLDENTSISGAVCKAVDTMSVEIFERGFGKEKRKVLPVKLDYEDHEIFIEDKTKTMSEEDIGKIRKAFTDFQNATGFTPALYMTEYNEWVYDYDSPSDFTRDFFDSHWKDGKHWLITYTIDPDDPAKWHWNTWIGGTVSALAHDAANDTVSTVMNENLKNENDSFADALVKTMEAMTAESCKSGQSEEESRPDILAAVVIISVFFEFSLWGIYIFKRDKKSGQY